MNGRTQVVAITGIAVLAVTVVIGSFVLAALRVEIPSGIIALGSAAGGSLATYLIPLNYKKGGQNGTQP